MLIKETNPTQPETPNESSRESDHLFQEKRALIDDFNFEKGTADVFDDMLDRSVPYYDEIQRMLGELAADFAVPGTNLYDLGCSTCNSFLRIDKMLPPEVAFVGVDSSEAMLVKGREKLTAAGIQREYQLICNDLNEGAEVSNASVVILNLTLQFIRPLVRARTVKEIADGVNAGGCLLLVEKVLCPNSTINRLFIKHYYEFKTRNGYSELEIAQKREALENILIPYQIKENTDLLLESGFTSCEIFFRWYNFSGILAIK